MEDKRMFTALALSFAVLMIFNFLFKPKRSETTDKPALVAEQQEGYKEKAVFGEEKYFPTKKQTPSTEQVTTKKDEKEVEIETDLHRIIFSDIGGAVKQIWLKGAGEENRVLLLQEEDLGKRLFSLQCSEIAGLEERKYQVKKSRDRIEFSLQEPEAVSITKSIEFNAEQNYLNVEVAITNLAAANENLSYIIAGPSGMKEIGEVKGRKFVEAGAMLDGEVFRKNAVKGRLQRTGEISWVGLTNRYFTAILKPYNETASVIMFGNKKEGLSTAIKTQNRAILPQETVRDEYLFYAGSIQQDTLASFGYHFEDIVNYGWFGGISKVLLKILRFFHKVTGNWGVAILLLTFVVNMVSFPLTKKSFTSMHRMKSIQPHMAKLKELHKDNPQKMNKEMMELYKKYNVNPFGGCLPMVLQIPIFISLYQGLMKAVELRGAGFLWIKDLAGPEAIPLPFSLPLIGAKINILPLIMAGMMVVQQKLNDPGASAMSQEQAGQQKMMMMLMPIFFGFILYNMPSGLVLYWLTNTMLMTGEHAFLKKRLG